MYPVYLVDGNGEKLDGSKNNYSLRFGPDELPPVNSFWSLTLYELPASLLYDNPLNRYLINSPMLPKLKRDPDGGLTIAVQHASPGGEGEQNWLPAPNGPFWAVLRLYWPKPEALDGQWKQPPLKPQAAAKPAAGGTVKVTPETYIRAESDRSFHNIQALAGGVNRFHHIRRPTPLDAQIIIRMNCDTLYSGAVIDTSKGASITLPKVPAGRFMSAQVIDNDHYCPIVYYEAGTHPIKTETRHACVAVRIQLFNPDDAAEVALVNSLQDQIAITAGAAVPFPPPDWEMESLNALTKQYADEAKKLASYKGLMGPRGKVDEARRHLVAAAGWGLNPDEDATYLNYSGEHDLARGYRAVYNIPENKAFWSITVYGPDGYIKSDNNILNSSTAKLNADGTFTAYFGSKDLCGDVSNRLDVTPGWNLMMRVYRPGRSVLDGSYKLPPAQALPDRK